jgi:hypothetical protein
MKQRTKWWFTGFVILLGNKCPSKVLHFLHALQPVETIVFSSDALFNVK